MHNIRPVDIKSFAAYSFNDLFLFEKLVGLYTLPLKKTIVCMLF